MTFFNRIVKVIKILVFSLTTVIVLFSQEDLRKEASTKTVIRIGYMSNQFSGVAQKDAEAALEVWARKFIEDNSLNYETTGAVYDDLVSIEQAFSKGEVDLVSLNALEFLSVRENSLFEPAMMASKYDTIKEEIILLVRKNSGIHGIHDFKSKSLKILNEIRGEMALLWLNTLLLKEGLPECHEFFRSIDSVEKPSQAILPIFFGQADVCVVTRTSFANIAELNPQLGRDLNILVSYPDLVFHTICFRRDFEPEHKDRILESIEILDDDPAGSQIMMLFSTKKLFYFDPELLIPVESLLNDYHRVKSLRKKTKGK